MFRAPSAPATDARDLPFTAVYLFGPDRQARLVSMTGLNDARLHRCCRALDDLAAAWGLGDHDWNRLRWCLAAMGDWLPSAGTSARPMSWSRPLASRARCRRGCSSPAPTRICASTRVPQFREPVCGQVTAGLANARTKKNAAADALAAVDRAKTAFFSNVSHEFGRRSR